jgi:PAS domain S-box-containing protein
MTASSRPSDAPAACPALVVERRAGSAPPGPSKGGDVAQGVGAGATGTAERVDGRFGPGSGARLPEILNALLEALPDGIVISDADGMIMFANARLQELSGYAPQELYGRSVELLVTEALHGAHARPRREDRANPRRWPPGSDLDIHLQHKYGTALVVDIARSTFRTTNGDVLVVASVRDATERRRAEQALQQRSLRLARLQERERVAFALRDQVIHSMFAVGLSLQTAMGLAAGQQRLEDVIQDVDRIITDIRHSCSSWHRHNRTRIRPSADAVRRTDRTGDGLAWYRRSED